MNICLVSQQYPPETAAGGIGSQTWTKARALARLGHSVHVLTASFVERAETLTETAEGIVVRRIRPPWFGASLHYPHTQWLAYSWAVSQELERLRTEVGLDVVDFAEYGAEGFAYQLNRARWNWLPVVVQLHGPLAMLADRIGWPETGGDFHRVGTFMEELSIQHADAVMACSREIAGFVTSHCGIPRESIDVVHCGVDTDAFTPSSVPRPANRPPTILFVGNIAKNKGVVTVVEAVLRVRKTHPNVKLQIAGRSTPLLKKLLAKPGAESVIEPLGFVDRATLPDLLRGADVLCAPSEYEPGVANVWLEAMACARPVIATGAGAAPEAITPGKTGMLVQPNDVESTAISLACILNNPDYFRELGAAARAHIEDYFAMDKYIQRVLAVYEKARKRAAAKLDALGGPPPAERGT